MFEIEADPFVPNQQFTLQDLSITGGDALNGGGIDAELETGDQLSLNRLRVHGNVSSGGGGGLNLTGSGIVSINNVVIENNHVVSGGFASGGGAAIGGAGLVDANRLVVRGNSVTDGNDDGLGFNGMQDAVAPQGGGLAFTGSGVYRLRESLIEDNLAGELLVGDTIDFDSLPSGFLLDTPQSDLGEYTGVRAAGVGGGISLNGSGRLVLDSVSVIGNTAHFAGGGIHLAGRQFPIAPEFSLEVVNSLFFDNLAQQGGGLWLFSDDDDNDLAIRHSTIAQNRAGQERELAGTTPLFTDGPVAGGGVHIISDASAVSFDHSIVADNELIIIDETIGAAPRVSVVGTVVQLASWGEYGNDVALSFDSVATRLQEVDLFLDVGPTDLEGEFTFGGQHSIFGTLDEESGGETIFGFEDATNDVIEVFRSEVTVAVNPGAMSVVAGPADPVLASELSLFSGIEFLDGSLFPILELAPDSIALDAGGFMLSDPPDDSSSDTNSTGPSTMDSPRSPASSWRLDGFEIRSNQNTLQR